MPSLIVWKLLTFLSLSLFAASLLASFASVVAGDALSLSHHSRGCPLSSPQILSFRVVPASPNGGDAGSLRVVYKT
jgi:hypothetical protein